MRSLIWCWLSGWEAVFSSLDHKPSEKHQQPTRCQLGGDWEQPKKIQRVLSHNYSPSARHTHTHTDRSFFRNNPSVTAKEKQQWNKNVERFNDIFPWFLFLFLNKWLLFHLHVHVLNSCNKSEICQQKLLLLWFLNLNPNPNLCKTEAFSTHGSKH